MNGVILIHNICFEVLIQLSVVKTGNQSKIKEEGASPEYDTFRICSFLSAFPSLVSLISHQSLVICSGSPVSYPVIIVTRCFYFHYHL